MARGDTHDDSSTNHRSQIDGRSVFVLGRFPPPIDGQAMATERLARLLDDDCRVHRVNVSPPAEKFVRSNVRFDAERLTHYLAARRRTARALMTRPASVVLWPSVSPTVLGHVRDMTTVLPALAPSQPLVAIVHWGNFDRLFRSRATALTARRMVRRLSRMVFLDDTLADRCARWVPVEKRTVIRNTIHPDVEATREQVEAKQRAQSTRTRLNILFLSNMSASKGYADLVAALRILRSSGLAFEARFAGAWESDADRMRFSDDIARGGLSDVVAHVGLVADRKTARELYLAADVFVLPTYYPVEAQPVTIIEALAAGTPIVTTRHGGIPQMVSEGQEAAFVEPRNPQQIADAIARLADDTYWQATSRRARARYEVAFGADVVRSQWLRLIDEVAADA